MSDYETKKEEQPEQKEAAKIEELPEEQISESDAQSVKGGVKVNEKP